MSIPEKKFNLVELIDILTRVIGEWETEFIRKFEAMGLTAKQVFYLGEIAKLDHPSFTEIAAALGVSKPSVTAIVNKFIEMGFMVKVQSDEDRRSAHVHLTQAGEDITKIHDQVHVNIANIFTNNLSKKDLDVLFEIMSKVAVKLV